jgi:hypothetical protein
MSICPEKVIIFHRETQYAPPPASGGAFQVNPIRCRAYPEINEKK